MFNMNPSTEQQIYEKTCLDEFEKFRASFQDEATPTTVKERGEAFPKFPINRLVYSLTYNDKIDSLSKEYHSPENGGEIIGYSATIGMQKYIDVAKIGNHTFSFAEAMDVIRSIRESVGPDIFYGAVIANKKYVDVNPLHPLVLNQFMRFNETELITHGLNNYSVIIYTFKEEWNLIKKQYPKKFKIEERFTQDVLDLVLGTKFKREAFTISSNFDMRMINGKYNIEYDEILVDKDGKKLAVDNPDINDKFKQSYIIPGQILNLKGITYPYYGAIYVKGGRAWNLSPMLATNVDNPQDTTWTRGSGICTKVGDARTALGCQTLNHSNTTSERNPYTLRDGSLGYAQVAVDVSLSMYYHDYDGTVQLKPEDKKMTLTEFLKSNPKAIKKDFFKYIRERIEKGME